MQGWGPSTDVGREQGQAPRDTREGRSQTLSTNKRGAGLEPEQCGRDTAGPPAMMAERCSQTPGGGGGWTLSSRGGGEWG